MFGGQHTLGAWESQRRRTTKIAFFQAGPVLDSLKLDAHQQEGNHSRFMDVPEQASLLGRVSYKNYSDEGPSQLETILDGLSGRRFGFWVLGFVGLVGLNDERISDRCQGHQK